MKKALCSPKISPNIPSVKQRYTTIENVFGLYKNCRGKTRHPAKSSDHTSTCLYSSGGGNFTASIIFGLPHFLTKASTSLQIARTASYFDKKINSIKVDSSRGFLFLIIFCKNDICKHHKSKDNLPNFYCLQQFLLRQKVTVTLQFKMAKAFGEEHSQNL